MESMFETLMQIPIFHGVSYSKLAEILGKHKFHFLKFNDGDTIINAGDNCTHISTIVSGKVKITTESQDKNFIVRQILEAPESIAPEFLFGKTTKYPATIEAINKCGIMQIEKKDYIEILNSDSIFLFNFLNILSMNAQLSTDGVLALSSGELSKRIAFWILSLTERNGKNIIVESKQNGLNKSFGVSPQQLYETLDIMKAADILDYTKSSIKIFDRRSLFEILESQQKSKFTQTQKQENLLDIDTN